MKKILLSLLVFAVASVCIAPCAFSFGKDKAKEVATEQKAIVNGYSTVQNSLWCVTFQLVWNELSEKFVKGPVNFEGGNPAIADELNKKLYTSDILSKNSYYTVYGKATNRLKNKIEKSIYKKFKETSDVLDMINWNVKDSYIFYSMLKKDFKFHTPFTRLEAAPFNGSTELVKFFGVNAKSSKKIKNNVQVLFYNSPEEYAIKLITKEKEDVILYRTDKDDTFTNLFNYVANNSNVDKLASKDTVMIPDLDVDKTISYDELVGKKISGTKYSISQALQTIKFKLDNKGGSLKSEAVIAIMRTSLRPEPKNVRHFNFDKKFVLFLMEEGKDKPYYAMKVDNLDYLVKEEVKADEVKPEVQEVPATVEAPKAEVVETKTEEAKTEETK